MIEPEQNRPTAKENSRFEKLNWVKMSKTGSLQRFNIDFWQNWLNNKTKYIKKKQNLLTGIEYIGIACRVTFSFSNLREIWSDYQELVLCSKEGEGSRNCYKGIGVSRIACKPDIYIIYIFKNIYLFFESYIQCILVIFLIFPSS